MTTSQPIPEQTQDVVTALRVQVDALAVELERLRAERDELEEARVVWERWAKEMERRNVALQNRLAEERTSK